ncbi:MAG: acyl-CoA dehydrogenase family protein, partial [Myxococcota bacterium]
GVDFDFSPEEERYRAEARAWLEAHVPPWARDVVPGDAGDEPGRFERLRAWQRELHEAGYLGVTWPVEFGGRGRTQVENAILQEELVRAGSPPIVNPLGIGLLAPALLHYGRPEQKRRFLEPMLRADEIWCQGYSEPGAGSDLASLQTRAERRGDVYVVNGQKVWTSQAHRADWCFALVRTDPDAPKHEGIGFLLLEMRSPGIEVRPIVQITGAREFNEVFFHDVEVPVENLVGAPTQGWRIANTVLGYERGANTLSQYAIYRRRLERMRAHTRTLRRPHRDVLRQRLAAAAIDVEVLRLNSLRQLTRLSRGAPPGPAASIQKLQWSEIDQRLHRLAVDIQGEYGQLAAGSPRALDGGEWQFHELNSLRFTIARGTSEIQRNIISERALGLPRR